jgi:hypothetical protein
MKGLPLKAERDGMVRIMVALGMMRLKMIRKKGSYM